MGLVCDAHIPVFLYLSFFGFLSKFKLVYKFAASSIILSVNMCKDMTFGGKVIF